MYSQPWEILVADKQAAMLEKIPLEWRLSAEYLTGTSESDVNVLDVPSRCGLLTSEELDIMENYNAYTLAKAVQDGSLKAKIVATAFCKRAAIAQQLTSCLTETFFDDAIKRGEWLDDVLSNTGKPVGPLHGRLFPTQLAVILCLYPTALTLLPTACRSTCQHQRVFQLSWRPIVLWNGFFPG